MIDRGRLGAQYRDGGAVPRRTEIKGQDHMLAYITPAEAKVLKDRGGAGKPGPGGIPSYYGVREADYGLGGSKTGGGGNKSKGGGSKNTGGGQSGSSPASRGESPSGGASESKSSSKQSRDDSDGRGESARSAGVSARMSSRGGGGGVAASVAPAAQMAASAALAPPAQPVSEEALARQRFNQRAMGAAAGLALAGPVGGAVGYALGPTLAGPIGRARDYLSEGIAGLRSGDGSGRNAAPATAGRSFEGQGDGDGFRRSATPPVPASSALPYDMGRPYVGTGMNPYVGPMSGSGPAPDLSQLGPNQALIYGPDGWLIREEPVAAGLLPGPAPEPVAPPVSMAPAPAPLPQIAPYPFISPTPPSQAFQPMVGAAPAGFAQGGPVMNYMNRGIGSYLRDTNQAVRMQEGGDPVRYFSGIRRFGSSSRSSPSAMRFEDPAPDRGISSASDNVGDVLRASTAAAPADPLNIGRIEPDVSEPILSPIEVDIASSTPVSVSSASQPSASQSYSAANLVDPSTGRISEDVVLQVRSMRPNVREFIDATGVDFNTAAQILYGSVGSNVDIRDWNRIMASGDPLRAAQAAAGQMYGLGADVPIATDPRFYDDTGAYDPTLVSFGQRIPGTRLTVTDGNLSGLGIISESGLPLTGLTAQNAASFGITQAEIDAALDAINASDEVRQRYAGAGYQPFDAGNLLVDYSGLYGQPATTFPDVIGAGVVSGPATGSGQPATGSGQPTTTFPDVIGDSSYVAPRDDTFITPVGGGAAYRPVDLPGYDPTITGMRPAPNFGIAPSGATAYSPYGAMVPYEFPAVDIPMLFTGYLPQDGAQFSPYGFAPPLSPVDYLRGDTAMLPFLP